MDIILRNCYGLSETTGGITIHTQGKTSLTEAGYPCPGYEVRIENPDEKGNGEICIRGRGVMLGYLKNAEATKEVIDNNGFFHSGDLGTITVEGFLKITGRIKELIITAGGENIAPVIIEDNFKEFCTICSNIMVVGEQQRFLTALITLKTEIDPATGVPTKKLTNEVVAYLEGIGVSAKTSDEALAADKVKIHINESLEKTNKKAVSRAATVRKWRLLPADFSLPGGELTATLKLKRKVTEKKYQSIIDEMYAEPEARM